MRTLVALLLLLGACAKSSEPPSTEPPPRAQQGSPPTQPPAPEPDARAPEAASAPDASAAPTPEPAAAASPKNLQVLPRSWSLARVRAFMKDEVSAGLGVKCDHCHDKGDFAADTKHKKEARQMIVLTEDLNKSWFGGKARIRCITCHLGEHEPPR